MQHTLHPIGDGPSLGSVRTCTGAGSSALCLRTMCARRPVSGRVERAVTPVRACVGHMRSRLCAGNSFPCVPIAGRRVRTALAYRPACTVPSADVDRARTRAHAYRPVGTPPVAHAHRPVCTEPAHLCGAPRGHLTCLEPRHVRRAAPARREEGFGIRVQGVGVPARRGRRGSPFASWRTTGASGPTMSGPPPESQSSAPVRACGRVLARARVRAVRACVRGGCANARARAIVWYPDRSGSRWIALGTRAGPRACACTHTPTSHPWAPEERIAAADENESTGASNKQAGADLIAGEKRGVDLKAADNPCEAQLDDAPVVARLPLAPSFPPVHHFACHKATAGS